MRIELERNGNMVSYEVIDENNVVQKKVGAFDASSEIAEARRSRKSLASILAIKEGVAEEPVARPSATIISVNPEAPMATNHSHEEFAMFHEHDEKPDDFAAKVHDHSPDVRVGELAANLAALAAKAAQDAALHADMGHPLPAHGHLEIQSRIQELDQQVNRWLEHEHPHGHAGYVSQTALTEAEARAEGRAAELAAQILDLSTRLQTLQNAVVDSANKLAARIGALEAKPLEPHEHNYASAQELQGLRQDLSLIQVHRTQTQPTKSELLDSILAGHDLHIAGKTNTHDRGVEIKYVCDCGFSISLPEGVLNAC